MSTDLPDKQLIAMALEQWANHIETGNVALSRRDVAQRLQQLPARREYDSDRAHGQLILTKIASLTDEQQRMVMRLRTMAATHHQA